MDPLLDTEKLPQEVTGIIPTTTLTKKKTFADVIGLPQGVLLFKHCLSEDEQMDVVNTCLQIAEQGGNEFLLKKEKYSSTSKKAIPLLFYNWPGRPKSIGTIPEPRDLLNFAHELFQSAVDKAVINGNNAKVDDERFKCPPTYEPNAVYAILYPHGGSFIPHLDGARGWVLSLSIGDAAEFYYSHGVDGERTRVRLESGDAIIFNGGQLHHGVSKIYPSSAPQFWNTHEISVYGLARLNLQFRDPNRDPSGLRYDPHFYAEDS